MFFLIRIKGRLRFRRVDVSLHKTCSKELATSLKLFFFKHNGKYNNTFVDGCLQTKNNRGTAQKIKFPLKDSLSNMTKYAVSCDLVTFTEEMLHGRRTLLCSVAFKI